MYTVRDDCLLTSVLTTNIDPSTSLCLPCVMISQPWPSVDPHSTTWTGVRLARKSPDSLSTERHLPSEVYWLSWLVTKIPNRPIANVGRARTYLDGGVGKGPGGRLVALLRLCKGSRVELGDGSGDDRTGGHEGREGGDGRRVFGNHGACVEGVVRVTGRKKVVGGIERNNNKPASSGIARGVCRRGTE